MPSHSPFLTLRDILVEFTLVIFHNVDMYCDGGTRRWLDLNLKRWFDEVGKLGLGNMIGITGRVRADGVVLCEPIVV